MNRKIAFVALVLLVQFSAGAQDFRYETVRDRNWWLRSDNVVGMRADSLSIARAELGGGYEAGGLRTSGKPESEWNVGAEAGAITHLKKFSMAGTFGFRQTGMNGACGSMFLTPGRYPLDVLEFTPGPKSLQSYSFSGAIAVPLSSRWSVGGSIDFKSSNYTKRKDLRYTDYALDLSLRPGIVCRFDSGATLGFALRLDRGTETVDAEQVGAAESSYFAFLDKGLGYGKLQPWGSDALHLDENGINGFPLKCLGYGASVQLSIGGWFAEMSYRLDNAKVGEKDALWYKFPNHNVSATVGYKLLADNAVEHIFRIDGDFARLNLNEAVIEKTTAGGVTTREVLGFNEIFQRSRFHVIPSWSAVKAGVFEFLASFEYFREDGVVALKYPDTAGRTVRSFAAVADARIYCKRWSFICGVSAANVAEKVKDAAMPGVDSLSDIGGWCNGPILGFAFSARAGVRFSLPIGIYFEALGEGKWASGLNRSAANLLIGYAF